MIRVSRFLCLAGLVAPEWGAAQSAGAPPCCTVTAIEIKRALASAEEVSTGHVFHFTVRDPELLRQLKVGQRIRADFATGQVTIDPASGPCCRIDPAPADQPCCTVVRFDPRTNRFDARVIGAGTEFQFSVRDPARIGAIKPGDRLWAKATRQVGTRPGEWCCEIVGTVPTGLP